MDRIVLKVDDSVAKFYEALGPDNKKHFTDVVSRFIEKGISTNGEDEELHKLVVESKNEWNSIFNQ